MVDRPRKKILVTGSREWADYECIAATLYAAQPTAVAHGAARGADRLAGLWAAKHGIMVQEYPAAWKRGTADYNRAAGFERNQAMLDAFQPHLVIAFKDHFDPTMETGGTEHMVKIAKEAGYEVQIIDRYDAPGLFD